MNLFQLTMGIFAVVASLAIFGVGLDIAIQLNRIADALTKLNEPEISHNEHEP